MHELLNNPASRSASSWNLAGAAADGGAASTTSEWRRAAILLRIRSGLRPATRPAALLRVGGGAPAGEEEYRQGEKECRWGRRSTSGEEDHRRGRMMRSTGG
jgi:hypothetical protein